MKMFGIARIGNDVVVRHTPQGKPLMDISLAFEYGRKGVGGKKPTQWVNATMWGDRCEKLQPYLPKGNQVCVTLSDPHIETYDKKDGTQGIKFAAIVDDLELIGGARSEPAKPSPKQDHFGDLDDDIPF